jgi:hypothetical protein
MLTRDERQVQEEPRRAPGPIRPDERRMAARRYAQRVRRLKLTVAVWAMWTTQTSRIRHSGRSRSASLRLPLWALIDWQDNAGFERWSNDSRRGDWDSWI